MKIVKMLMPQMGESILECTVLTLLKQVGDRVETDDSIMEVATDKVDTEVPSRYTGIIREWLVKVDDVVAIGGEVALIETDGEEAEEEQPPVEDIARQLEGELETVSAAYTGNRLPAAAGTEGNNGFYSPLVLSIAREEDIPLEELPNIPGTGAESRITKKDILGYLANRGKDMPETVERFSVQEATGEVEIIAMDRMRKMIAQRMVSSKQISPHVTSFVETDMTNMVKWRDRVKQAFMDKTGHGLTFTPLLVEAVVKALKDFPLINVSVEGEHILVKKAINVGIAVSLPSGNLIVPVIHRADQYDLAGLALKVNDLVKRARHNKLTGDDLVNGTYTISNIGTFGNIMGTPIILQPQVAIMAFGAIQKKPAVIETPSGDFVGIRHKMFISHSYDHRVVDGALGGMFVKRVSDYLEQFDVNTAL